MRAATGSLRVTERSRHTRFLTSALGIVQTVDGWAGLTARVPDERLGTHHTLLVIVEQRDPWMAERVPSATLVLDGERELPGR
ncbi:MAG: hypothetical protein LC791_10795 [Acidobacteria bacterium]|nr:hypothetical protein [Acidobacteriota bacterium]